MPTLSEDLLWRGLIEQELSLIHICPDENEALGQNRPAEGKVQADATAEGVADVGPLAAALGELIGGVADIALRRRRCV